MGFGDIGGVRLSGRPYGDLAEGAVIQGRAVTWGSERRTKAWVVGATVKGVALQSAGDGERVETAAPGSTVWVENGLLAGETRTPGVAGADAVAILSSGAFGVADEDAGLPATGHVVEFADENSTALLVQLDGAMRTGDGMATKTKYITGDTNQVTIAAEGVMWTGYPTDPAVLAAAADLFVSSADAGANQTVRVRGTKGPLAAIPYEEFVVDVVLNGQAQVNFTTGDAGLTGTEAPLDVNSMVIMSATAPAGVVYVGDAGVAAGVPTNNMMEIAMRDDGAVGGLKSRGMSHALRYTVPGGWRGTGVITLIHGAFKDSSVVCTFETPGLYRQEAVLFHLESFEQATFQPGFAPGSVTAPIPSFQAPGTRITARTFGGVGSGDGGGVFGIELELIP